MSEDVSSPPALIGPNAVLQLLPVIDRLGGAERRAQILARAGIFDIPDGTRMIPETQAARLHRQVRQEDPDLAPALLSAAGSGTADYILAHRIPVLAQWVLRHLPPAPSARMLSTAIEKHAWTFAGSGRFRVIDPWCFEIIGNPLIKGEHAAECLCHWHRAVFTRLYQTLVSPTCDAHEQCCGAQDGACACRFEISR